jgi:branched-chain amino acid transport system ATP-binding protein
MLQIDNIDVYYGDVQALWDISFEVKKGEIVSLVGPNGAGKTTTLNTISGLLRPKKGKIAFQGQDLAKIPDYRMINLGIAHVPEARRLFPEMTVVENLDMGSLTREAKARREESKEWVLSLFPILKERAWQEAGTLSGGEAQMLAVARGLMSRPKLIMMDEPSLGLAPLLVSQIFEITEQIHNEGVTVLLVEQNVFHALKSCTRAYVMETGRVVLQGSGNELMKDEHIKTAYLGV